MGSPMASSHWLTSFGDHWSAISTMQDDEVGATFGNFVATEDELRPAPMDEVEADPRLVLLRPPMLPRLPVMPLPRLMEGDRPNLGTLNQEFLLPDSYKNLGQFIFRDFQKLLSQNRKPT